MGNSVKISVPLMLVLLAAPLAAQPVEFANAEPIRIKTRSADADITWRVAAPYPSTIDVKGFGPGDRIAKITVTLHRMYHDFPDDVDMLLVGPEGQSMVIFSDALGDVWDSDLELTIALDDHAPDSLEDELPVERDGVYRPMNFANFPDDPSDVVDIFPEEDETGSATPHPEPSPATALSTFAGTHPNGVWRLFVVDDEPEDAGYIDGGWSLEITTEGSQVFRRGDSNQDALIDMADPISTLAALFLGGAQPACADAADADDDGSVGITDAVFTLDYLFRGGPPPPGFPAACDLDRTSDDLSCQAPPPCPA